MTPLKLGRSRFSERKRPGFALFYWKQVLRLRLAGSGSHAFEPRRRPSKNSKMVYHMQIQFQHPTQNPRTADCEFSCGVPSTQQYTRLETSITRPVAAEYDARLLLGGWVTDPRHLPALARLVLHRCLALAGGGASSMSLTALASGGLPALSLQYSQQAQHGGMEPTSLPCSMPPDMRPHFCRV